MIKDAYEDYKRSLSDKKENETQIMRYDHSTKHFKKISWKDIKVGDIVKVEDEQFVPADIVLL